MSLPPFYEYSVHARSRRILELVIEMGVSALDFDPRAQVCPRFYGSPWERVTRLLRRAVGIRRDDDFHLFITGPSAASVAQQFRRMLEGFGAHTDGGGFDFTYDPYEVYSAQLVEKYQILTDREQAEAEERLRLSMSPEERERHDALMREMDARFAEAWGEDDND